MKKNGNYTHELAPHDKCDRFLFLLISTIGTIKMVLFWVIIKPGNRNSCYAMCHNEVKSQNTLILAFCGYTHSDCEFYSKLGNVSELF